MTMLLVIGMSVASISWLMAWTRLQAEQVKYFRRTRRQRFARRSESQRVVDYLRGVLE